jgi:cytochrome c peroxidase
LLNKNADSLKNRLFLPFCAISFLLFLLSFNLDEKKYSVKELRELYGSGNVQLWPKPFLFSEAKKGFKEIGSLPEMEYPIDNPYSKEKADLGKKLFFDSNISESQKISCASCHSLEMAFADGKMLGLGHNNQEGVRNVITILNSGFAKSLFWDGRAKSLEEQVKHPIENPVEMNLKVEIAVERINKNQEYRELFSKAFGSSIINEETISKAIATYERTLVSPKSRFDVFIEGKKDELTDSEIRGLHLFRTKANCINCHNSSTFSDNQFHNIGLDFFNDDDNDFGRYDVTHKNEDKRKFKTPSLREVSQTKPYMHNGQFPELRNVLMMYNVGMGKENLTPKQKKDIHYPKKSGMIKPLNLNDDEIDDIISFLKTLSSYKNSKTSA